MKVKLWVHEKQDWIEFDYDLDREEFEKRNIQIGTGVRIKSDVWIGSDVEIGPNVRIKSNIRIGSGVRIGSGTKIGSDVTIVAGASVEPKTCEPTFLLTKYR